MELDWQEFPPNFSVKKYNKTCSVSFQKDLILQMFCKNSIDSHFPTAGFLLNLACLIIKFTFYMKNTISRVYNDEIRRNCEFV